MTKDEQRFINLGWYLLEAKFVYYDSPPGVKGISDIAYDKLEDEYKALAEKLGKNPSACMVGFSTERPSCRIVAEKVTTNKKMSELK